MGNVIQVDFAALRAQRDSVTAVSHTKKGANTVQAAMLRLCEMQMNALEFTTLGAAIHDYEVYSKSGTHNQLLVDVYHMLEGFKS